MLVNHKYIFNIGLTGFLLALLCVIAMPIQASIVLVALLAGMHNIFEFRYFLSKMPVRWGKSRPFYSLAIGGVLILSGLYVLLFLMNGWLWMGVQPIAWVVVWHLMVLAWGVMLYRLSHRYHQILFYRYLALASILAAFIIAFPKIWSIALIYIHPCLAFVFLYKQIKRTHPSMLHVFKKAMMAIIMSVLLLWLLTAALPDVSIDGTLSQQIVAHAGKTVLLGFSSHLLVASHVWLELLHYLVWIVCIPIVDKRSLPWHLHSIPLYAHRLAYPKLVLCGLLVACMVVMALWIGFSLNYGLTREIYFAIAIAHVLIELPFLIRN